MKKWIAGLVLVALVAAGLFLSPPARVARAQSSSSYHTLANGWNIGTVASGAAVFGSDIVPTYPTSVVRVAIVVGSSAPMAIRETDGTHTFTSLLNGGTNLTAGCCYTFVWECRCATASGGVAGQPTGINFIVGSGTTVPVLRVTEVTAAVD